MIIVASVSERIEDIKTWPGNQQLAARVMDLLQYYIDVARQEDGENPLGHLSSAWMLRNAKLGAMYTGANGYLIIAEVESSKFDAVCPHLNDAVIVTHLGTGIEQWGNMFVLRKLVRNEELVANRLRLSPDAARSLGVVQATLSQARELLGDFTATVLDLGDKKPYAFSAIWPKGASLFIQSLISEDV